MPAPTLSERVEKLKESVSTLFVWADLADRDLTRIETVLGKTTDTVQDIATRLAAIEERLNELKRVTEESGRRKFSLGQGLLCPALGAALALAGQIGLIYVKARLGVGP